MVLTRKSLEGPSPEDLEKIAVADLIDAGIETINERGWFSLTATGQRPEAGQLCMALSLSADRAFEDEKALRSRAITELAADLPASFKARHGEWFLEHYGYEFSDYDMITGFNDAHTKEDVLFQMTSTRDRLRREAA